MSKTQSYPSDLTEEQWVLIQPLLPKPHQRGRRRRLNYRDVLDAIFYLERTGCQWRQLPHDFPPWGTVAAYFHRWRTGGLWERIHTLHAHVRRQAGKKPMPTADILDSQSVKTAEGGPERGYDAGKNISGRKRHLLVDILGMVIACVVHAADIQDEDGCEAVLDRAQARFPQLQTIWADSRYACKGHSRNDFQGFPYNVFRNLRRRTPEDSSWPTAPSVRASAPPAAAGRITPTAATTTRSTSS